LFVFIRTKSIVSIGQNVFPDESRLKKIGCCSKRVVVIVVLEYRQIGVRCNNIVE